MAADVVVRNITQKIRVDAINGIVSVVNTGPQGPAGPPGPTTVQDTGFLDISGDIINGWTVTSAWIRRWGAVVELLFDGLDGSASTGTAFLNMPVGFWPPGDNNVVGFDQVSLSPNATPTMIAYRIDGDGPIRGPQAVSAGRGVIQWTTDNGWPPVLPGV